MIYVVFFFFFNVVATIQFAVYSYYYIISRCLVRAARVVLDIKYENVDELVGGIKIYFQNRSFYDLGLSLLFYGPYRTSITLGNQP